VLRRNATERGEYKGEKEEVGLVKIELCDFNFLSESAASILFFYGNSYLIACKDYTIMFKNYLKL